MTIADLAKTNDTITIRIVGINPNGIPNAIEVQYERDGEFLPMPVNMWYSLRHDLFCALTKWWIWIDILYGKEDNNEPD